MNMYMKQMKKEQRNSLFNDNFYINFALVASKNYIFNSFKLKTKLREIQG